MNNLIQKAIQAIQDGKTEYAIGLLEGALQMSQPDKVLSNYSPVLPTFPSPVPMPSMPMPYTIGAMATAKSPESETKVSDVVEALEQGAKAKLEAVKAMSKQSTA